MYVCAGESEQFAFAEPIGIGLVDAAARLDHLCRTRSPESLHFVGTAGSYGDHALMQIVEVGAATQIETGFWRGDCYTPIENRIVSSGNVSRETIVNSSNCITTDPQAAAAFRAEGIGLENMEFFAVLRVAQMHGIPAQGTLIVTNYCDARAHEDFLAHRTEAMRRLEDYLQDKGALHTS